MSANIDVVESTAVQKAVGAGDMDELAKLWQENEEEFKVLTKEGSTLAHLAAVNDYDNILEFLLTTCKIDASVQDKLGNTVLHTAAANGHIKIVQLLMQPTYAINIEEKTKDGNTPLHLAAMFGHVNVIECLLENGANSNSVNSEGLSPLHWAACNGHLAAVKLLIRRGANRDAKASNDCIPVNYAQHNKHTEVEKFLFDPVKWMQMQVNLQNAVVKGNQDAIEALAGDGAIIDDNTLALCIIKGSVATLRFLLTEYKIDLNIAINHDGECPLHIAACRRSEAAFVALLLEKGANIDVKDKQGYTALHWAAKSGHTMVIRVLAEHKAELHAKCNKGGTALYYAIEQDRLDSVVSLVKDYGLKVNINNAEGETPLHLAAFKGHQRVVKFLVENGAEIDVKDNDGLRPIDMAKENGHEYVCYYLENYQKKHAPSFLVSTVGSLKHYGHFSARGQQQAQAAALLGMLAFLTANFVYLMNKNTDDSTKPAAGAIFVITAAAFIALLWRAASNTVPAGSAAKPDDKRAKVADERSSERSSSFGK